MLSLELGFALLSTFCLRSTAEFLQVKHGDNITLPSPVSSLYGDYHVLWTFNNKTLIKLGLGTSPQKPPLDYVNRLSVNLTTGSLLLFNLSSSQTGIYSGQIINGDYGVRDVLYNVSVLSLIFASTVQTLTAVEGGNVTFWKGLNGKTHAILTDSHRKILLNSDNGLEQRRANNIYVENGSIIMTNVHQNDSDVTYTLQLYNPVEVTYSFKLYITKRQHQVYDTTAQPPQPSDPPKTNADHTVIYVTVGLIVAAVAAVAVAVIMYYKRESLRNMINRICRRDLTNGSYCGPTSQQEKKCTSCRSGVSNR